MIDYILKFPSKPAAEQFALANGFAVIDEDKNIIPLEASPSHAFCGIGEHNGDGQYWVLFRDLVGIPVPAGGEAFIYWASTSSEPRPTDESAPNIFWA